MIKRHDVTNQKAERMTMRRPFNKHSQMDFYSSMLVNPYESDAISDNLCWSEQPYEQLQTMIILQLFIMMRNKASITIEEAEVSLLETGMHL